MATATIEKESAFEVQTTKTTADVLRSVFDANHLAYGKRSIEMCEDIIKQCKQQGYSAFKAATVICEELEIEMRINRTAIELALINNNILTR